VLYAQLHGKLRWEQETLEDLLTSNVFGALKYVPASLGLVPFLRRAEGKRAPELVAALASNVADVSYEFWPRLASCEPDVLIRLSLEHGPRLLILVEAKLHSGKSTKASGDDEPVSDQLAREWQSVQRTAQGEERQPFLLYVTADYYLPADDIEHSQDELRKKEGAEGLILWLSWRVLGEVARSADSPLLDEVARLLIERYALSSFDGITPRKARATWRFAEAAGLESSEHPMYWTFRGELAWHFDNRHAAAWRPATHNPWRWGR
jgi:hypothetical protein